MGDPRLSLPNMSPFHFDELFVGTDNHRGRLFSLISLRAQL